MRINSADGPVPSALVQGSTATELVTSLGLVSLDELVGYETPDEEQVATIARALIATQVLINPVVVDVGKTLLIDGHHRAAAFKWLGLKAIPAFRVSYESPEVQVKNWWRVTSASAVEVANAFRAFGPGGTGEWRVVAVSSHHGVVCEERFSDARKAADFLAWMSRYMTTGGHTVTLETEWPAPSVVQETLALYVDPVIGKPQVTAAVERREHFPAEVNRHLVRGRPLNLRCPLSYVKNRQVFEGWLERTLTELEVRPVRTSGVRANGRYYEEDAVLIRPVDQ